MADEFPLFRGFTPSLMYNSEWAPVDYWFVNPAARIGRHVNYGRRIREERPSCCRPARSSSMPGTTATSRSSIDETYDALGNIVMKEAFDGRRGADR